MSEADPIRDETARTQARLAELTASASARRSRAARRPANRTAQLPLLEERA